VEYVFSIINMEQHEPEQVWGDEQPSRSPQQQQQQPTSQQEHETEQVWGELRRLPRAAAAAAAASIQPPSLVGPLENPGHKLCIIFDGFRTSKTEGYVPKKCSFFNISTGTNLATYFIGPPYPWETLHTTARDVNSFISRYAIGTSWYSGEMPFDKFMIALLRHADGAAQIFTNGANRVKYLAKVLGRRVFDIEPLMKEIPADVIQTFKNDLPKMQCAFMDHTRTFFSIGYEAPQYSCCQDRAYFYGHIMRYYFTSTGQKEFKKQLAKNVRNQPPAQKDINRGDRVLSV
jgi:hypothetical protein